MNRNSPLSLWIVSILLGANLALIASYSATQFSELDSQYEGDFLFEDTWDFGVGGRYNPGSANIDSNEKVVVILAETSDKKMSHSKSYFEDMLFGQEYGSMSHYFSEATYGYTDMTGVVVDPVRLPKSLTYYDPGNEENILEAIEEAISLADASINFSPYDQDGDGSVDNFMIIFVGESDAANGDADGDGENEDAGAIWPHKWQLGSGYNTNDGVSINKYFTCAEECGLGTFAHEIAHNFGLPDLYDSADHSSEGIGEWGLMGSGSHLRTNSGTPNPAHLSAWSKQELGLIEPTVIDISVSQTYTLRAASSHADALKIPITSTEYFLIEFRSNTASDYDAGLHSTGILIWHIDEDICASVHSVNGDENHPCVRLIQADDDKDLEKNVNRGDSGDTWQSGRSFNPNSAPSSISYSGASVNLQMTVSAVYSSYATVHFGSFTAWFYSVTAEVQDSNGDGFDNEILFTYDPDTDSSSQDIMVQFDFYEADKTGVPYSFYENNTIEGSDGDSFEYKIGYYNGYSNGLWWIEVRLWVGEDMTDLKVFGNIWIEYPSPSNNDNEWFESVNWNTLDTTGDGSNDSLVVDFETVSSQLGGTANVYLELYTDENVSSRHSVIRNDIDWGSHSITLDMSETDLPPGILRGNLVLIVDSQREHIASTLNLDLWWDSVRLNNAIASAHDLDEDGTFDSIEVFVNIDHSLRTDTLVMFEVNAWNMTDFDGFASMQETRSIPLGLASEGSSGGRGEQSFWLYAEWDQEVLIEIRAILPNGKEFTTMINWDELNGEYGFSLQPLDWTVTAWLTDHQLLDSNGDEQQDLFRTRYDFDSVSDALDVAVELEVTTPDNSHFSIWDNYTITGDLYDLRSLEFTTWYTGQHEFTLRVHDLSDNKIEFEKSFGQFILSSGFDPLSLNLTTNFESVTTLGNECQIHAILNDKIGESYNSVGEIKWFGLPFTPSISVDILDCSQWPEGTHSVSASYVNGLGLEVESVISVEVVLPPTPPDIVFDLSNVPDLGRDSCEIGINNAIDSINILTIESYEWYVNGVLSSTTTEKLSCSEFDFGLTYIEIYAYGEGDTFDVEKANIVLNMDPASPDSNSSVEISLKSNTETESGGLITIAILCLIALIIPAFVFRNRTSDEESNYDIGDAMWLKDTPPHLPSESNMGFQHDNFIPPPRQSQWEEIVDDDGYQWRKYLDGRVEWYDSQTDEWNLYEQ